MKWKKNNNFWAFSVSRFFIDLAVKNIKRIHGSEISNFCFFVEFWKMLMKWKNHNFWAFNVRRFFFYLAVKKHKTHSIQREIRERNYNAREASKQILHIWSRLTKTWYHLIGPKKVPYKKRQRRKTPRTTAVEQQTALAADEPDKPSSQKGGSRSTTKQNLRPDHHVGPNKTRRMRVAWKRQSQKCNHIGPHKQEPKTQNRLSDSLAPPTTSERGTQTQPIRATPWWWWQSNRICMWIMVEGEQQHEKRGQTITRVPAGHMVVYTYNTIFRIEFQYW